MVTIALLAAGVVLSYVTLRPRPAAAAGRGRADRESAAVGELTVGDELAGEMMVTDAS